jgi:hypothetical protein
MPRLEKSGTSTRTPVPPATGTSCCAWPLACHAAGEPAAGPDGSNSSEAGQTVHSCNQLFSCACFMLLRATRHCCNLPGSS